MKGDVDPKHNIETLFQEFKDKYPNESELNEFFNKYTDDASLPSCIQEFLSENKIKFEDLYRTLRYPVNTKFEDMKTYYSLTYRGEDNLPFFGDLHIDLVKVFRAASKLGRSLEQLK
jgi:hypothetical protein